MTSLYMYISLLNFFFISKPQAIFLRLMLLDAALDQQLQEQSLLSNSPMATYYLYIPQSS